MRMLRKNDIGPAAVIMLTMATCIVGCTNKPVDDEFHPAWPSPPEQARIIHRENLAVAGDFGTPNFFEQLGALITGTQRHAMLRPSGIAVDDKHLVIADQELQGVHIFTFGKNKAEFISSLGDMVFVSPVGVAIIDDLFAVTDSAIPGLFLFDKNGKLVRSIAPPDGFKRPTGLAYDVNRKELFVADTEANLIYVFNLQGDMLRSFGQRGKDVEQFNYPTHLYIDSQSRLYVTDSMNFRVQVFDTNDRYLFDIGRHGDASGHLGIPKGIAVDSFGHIYIIDSYFCNVQIFNEQGQLLLSFGGPGQNNGQFQVPTGLTIGSENRIYVSDSYNKRVQVFQYVGGLENED